VVEDHIAWQKSNNWWRLGLAIAGSGFLAFIFADTGRRQKVGRMDETTETLSGPTTD
jgi:hypothetical protein